MLRQAVFMACRSRRSVPVSVVWQSRLSAAAATPRRWVAIAVTPRTGAGGPDAGAAAGSGAGGPGANDYRWDSPVEADAVIIEPERAARVEDIEGLRRRLMYQSRKRGIKENDLIFRLAS